MAFSLILPGVQRMSRVSAKHCSQCYYYETNMDLRLRIYLQGLGSPLCWGLSLGSAWFVCEKVSLSGKLSVHCIHIYTFWLSLDEHLGSASFIHQWRSLDHETLSPRYYDVTRNCNIDWRPLETRLFYKVSRLHALTPFSSSRILQSYCICWQCLKHELKLGFPAFFL